MNKKIFVVGILVIMVGFLSWYSFGNFYSLTVLLGIIFLVYGLIARRKE